MVRFHGQCAARLFRMSARRLGFGPASEVVGRGPEPAPFVLMLRLCTAYPQDSRNGSRSYREPALDPRCMSRQPLPVALPYRPAPRQCCRRHTARNRLNPWHDRALISEMPLRCSRWLLKINPGADRGSISIAAFGVWFALSVLTFQDGPDDRPLIGYLLSK